MSIGGHQSAIAQKVEWLTPPAIVRALGPFDLDPCSPAVRPWPTATVHYSEDEDGLSRPWFGRVWLNPPYGKAAAAWIERLADHGDGIATLFARTETEMFAKSVWSRADALLFIDGRLHFYHVDGSRAAGNSGGPSVLIAYGQGCAEMLGAADIPGAFVHGWDFYPKGVRHGADQ